MLAKLRRRKKQGSFQSDPRSLYVRDLCVSQYGLDFRFNFHIAKNERVHLRGENGIGKTTLIRAIAGLIPCYGNAQAGIFFGSTNRIKWQPERRNWGVVFQNSPLVSTLTVIDNLTLGLRFRGFDKKERLKLGRKWLENVQLLSSENKTPSELSGGERQRIALAQALIWNPEAILLDEPFTALDSIWKSWAIKTLCEHTEKTGAPVLLTSHDLDLSVSWLTRSLEMKLDSQTNCRVVFDRNPN